MLKRTKTRVTMYCCFKQRNISCVTGRRSSLLSMISRQHRLTLEEMRAACMIRSFTSYRRYCKRPMSFVGHNDSYSEVEMAFSHYGSGHYDRQILFDMRYSIEITLSESESHNAPLEIQKAVDEESRCSRHGPEASTQPR